MTDTEKAFTEELTELLNRYRQLLSVPHIMDIAQHVFHKKLSFRYNPELFPHAKTELDHLKEFLARPGKEFAWTCINELTDKEK